MNSMGTVTVKPFGENYQTADWKMEKHVPVIDCPDQIKTEEMLQVRSPSVKRSPTPILPSTTLAG